MRGFSRVLAATDFSPVGNRAAVTAFALVGDAGGRVYLVHVVDRPHVPNPMYAHYVAHTVWDPEHLREAVRRAMRGLTALVPEWAAAAGIVAESRVVQADDPADAILELAVGLDVEVVAVGRGRKGIESLLLGSVADKVVHKTRRAVLVVH